MMATRRGVLIGFVSGGAAMVTGGAAIPPPDDSLRRVETLVNLLTKEMAKLHGGVWKFEIDHDAQFVLVVPLE